MEDDRFYCRAFLSPPAPASPGPEWGRPEGLVWADEVIRRAVCRARGGWCRRVEEGVELAYPLDCRSPFPLPPLFCFAQVKCLGDRGWWVFSLDGEGLPRREGGR